jgi:hypothetical protein
MPETVFEPGWLVRNYVTKSNNTFWEFITEHVQYINLDIRDRFTYGGSDKSLARPTSWCILFDGENISFDASLVIYIYIYIYIYSTNIPPIMIINKTYENKNLLSL